MLVAPQLPNAYAIAGGEAQPIPMDVFGLTVPVVGYQGSVLPALVLGIFAAKLQRWLKTFVPDLIDLIVTPFLTLLISMLLGLLVVGPIMHTLEIGIFGAVQTFLQLPLGIGGFIVGGLRQLVIAIDRDLDDRRHHAALRCRSASCAASRQNGSTRRPS